MNDNVKISIIVPAYNVEKWLPRCLDSIISQQHTNWELIVIDDGSTDSTPDILDSYAKMDTRIVAVHQKNMGLVEVRNHGIVLSSGDYIGFVDGDDSIEPDMYARLLNNARTHDAEISHCGLKVVYENGTYALHYGTGNVIVQDQLSAIRDLLFGNVDPSLCNKLFKREVLIDSCIDKSVLNNEDLLRNFAVYKRAKTIVYEDFCGYIYWSRKNSMSNDGSALNRALSSVQARKRILENSDKEEYLYALRALLTGYINALNGIANCKEEKAEKLRMEAQCVLKQNWGQLHLLSVRQRIIAWLICLSPKLHRLIYRGYKILK